MGLGPRDVSNQTTLNPTHKCLSISSRVSFIVRWTNICSEFRDIVVKKGAYYPFTFLFHIILSEYVYEKKGHNHNHNNLHKSIDTFQRQNKLYEGGGCDQSSIPHAKEEAPMTIP
jgi:hypothetical protein